MTSQDMFSYAFILLILFKYLSNLFIIEIRYIEIRY